MRSIVAPSGAGKSAAILPAFLEMQRFHEESEVPVPSMYIYMPFHNNFGRSHLPPVFLSFFPQCLQYFLGQAYMLCCFELMLHGRYYQSCFQVLIWFCRAFIVWVRAGAFSRGDLWNFSVQQLVKQAVGDENRILVHVDEHFAMSETPQFRQGALGVLANFDTQLLVVTTYTAITFEFRLWGSDISRYFVVLPPLLSFEALSANDHWKLTGTALQEFKKDTNSATALSILFSMLVQGMGPKWLHVSPKKLSQDGDYYMSLHSFYHTRWNMARQESLRTCCNHCTEMTMKYMRNPRRPASHQHELVFQLISGISFFAAPDVAGLLTEANMSEHSVVGFEQIITKPLVQLLQIQGNDTPGAVWETGRRRLLTQMAETSHLINVDKALECAFICAFDLSSKRPGTFAGRPESCKASVLFKQENGQVVVQKKELAMKPNVLAFAVDKPSSHPWVDLWIKNADGEMTVMQVTGSRSWTKVKQKCGDLESALKLLNESQNEQKRNKLKFRALMLAPNIPPNEGQKCRNDHISILTTEARDWLGGLAQLCTYIYD